MKFLLKQVQILQVSWWIREKFNANLSCKRRRPLDQQHFFKTVLKVLSKVFKPFLSCLQLGQALLLRQCLGRVKIRTSIYVFRNIPRDFSLSRTCLVSLHGFYQKFQFHHHIDFTCFNSSSKFPLQKKLLNWSCSKDKCVAFDRKSVKTFWIRSHSSLFLAQEHPPQKQTHKNVE